ncbi:peptidylprolyl isomerase [uncultured Tenacibaculum sp.]|uniref:FKBP-type peptidyl-prolyl cis-trans isomerase n=1 Tax=uncultured Tenacibaculum sp. TaxID=174713 RepID=UPI002638D8DB|nr:peptidylprolyl isomerase [uncultured Tenacibaculum sp.]
MIKFKHFFYTAIVSVILYSCGTGSGNTIAAFDHKGQAVKDKDSIIKFLNNYYYDDTKDSIKPLVSGKTPLSQDSRVIKKSHTVNDIEYDLYHIVVKEGESPKGSPTAVDSVLTKYQVWYSTKTSEFKLAETGATAQWWSLAVTTGAGFAPSPIRGWAFGIPNFKAGINDPINGPINYKKFGKGILIMPSGLAYQNRSANSVPANAQLIFYIDLLDFAVNTDHDLDKVPTILEDINKDGIFINDRTDDDALPNYLDSDDDGDGKLTKDEDANGDGDPTNDFSDPNKPTVPDYLNRDIK